MYYFEELRAQTGLTQCYNCQKLSHVSTNCKQFLRCLWCGSDHLHRECPEKTKAESTPSCCNGTLVKGENPLPASYWGCSNGKGEEQNKLPRNPLGGGSFLSSPHQSNPKQLHSLKTRNTSNHKHRRHVGKAPVIK
jgi:hypothetical protein